MRDASDEERASQSLCHLEGDAFDFYYDVFAKDGALTAEAKDYNAVKAAFIEQFKPEEGADGVIRRSMAARLDYGDLPGSLRDMDRLFEKANFNGEAKFGLLRNAVMEHLDLAQFAVYRGVTSYIDLQKAVKDFWSGLRAFQSSAVFSHLPDRVHGDVAKVGVGDLKIVPAKKLLLRPDARVANVENKVDALVDQLSQLTLLIKKQGIQQPGEPSSQSAQVRVCSLCKKSGHGENQCDISPHRNTICPRCGKRGHSESTCWARITPEMARKVGFSGVKSESQAEQKLASNSPRDAGPEQFTIVTADDSPGEDFVATTKRNSAGQALPKQARIYGVPTPSHVDFEERRPVPARVPVESKASVAANRHLIPKPRPRKPRNKRTSKKAGIAELVGKYHMLAQLARAPCGLTFGQLMWGDADQAKREIRRLFSSKVSRSVLAQVGGPPRRLKVVSVRVYGTVAQALLGFGAEPNLMSTRLARSLSLRPEPTAKKITVADGTNAVVRGTVSDVPVSFGGLTEALDFLLISGTPFDVIIGCPALERLHACLDLGQQQVTITVNGESVQLGFEYDNFRYRFLNSGTDSEDFTSDISAAEATPEIYSDSTSEEEEFVVAVLDEEPFEPDLQVTIWPELLDFDEDDDTPDDLPELIEVEMDTYSDSDSGCDSDSELEPGDDTDSEDEEDCCSISLSIAPDDLVTQEMSSQGRPSISEDTSEELEEDTRATALAAKLAHLPNEVQKTINATLRDSGIVAWSLDDLRPSDVPVTRDFELEDNTRIQSRVRRLPPRHATVVRG